MFPWNIEDLGRIVVGRPLLPIFQEIVQKESALKIGRSILGNSRCKERRFERTLQESRSRVCNLEFNFLVDWRRLLEANLLAAMCVVIRRKH